MRSQRVSARGRYAGAAGQRDDLWSCGRIWTRDLSKAHTLATRLKTGSVWINCYNIFDAALPFGGYKQSGWGREMGEAVLENYLQTKAVTISL